MVSHRSQLFTKLHFVLVGVAVFGPLLFPGIGRSESPSSQNRFANSPALFADDRAMAATNSRPSATEAAVVRKRRVSITAAAYNSDSFTFSPFLEETFLAVRTKPDPKLKNNVSIFFGDILNEVDESVGTITLTSYHGPETAYAGRLELTNGLVYIIAHEPNGAAVIKEVNEGLEPPCGTDFSPTTINASPSVQGLGTEGESIATDDNTSIAAEAALTQIDVMVVYTPSARSVAGGTSAMLAAINNGIAVTNQAYVNSQVNTALQLVHTAELAYTETNDFYLDLQRITGTSDGYLDQVHTLRNTYKADLVTLLNSPASNNGVAGIAWVMQTASSGFRPNGFSVVGGQYMTSGLTYAHELGHNMGATHDHNNSDPTDGLYLYSFGHRFGPLMSNNYPQYRTIMAYPPPYPGPYGSRVAYFSNPNVLYLGYPTGIPEGPANAADNARTLNQTSAIISNFYSNLSISGTILAEGSPLSGVMVNGGSLGSVSTNAAGFYTFPSVTNGQTYTLTASKTGYSFSPVSPQLTISGASLTQNFSATVNTYTINGRVTLSGSGFSGVTINGGALGTRTSDVSGNYSFTGVRHGTAYTLTPSKTGYSFTPISTSGTLTGPATVNFQVSSYSLTGRVTVGGAGLSGVSINGGSLGSRTTNTNGDYTFENVPHGTAYSLIPSKSGYTFSPNPANGTVTGPTTVNITATASSASYPLTGQVTLGGASLSGVLINGGTLGTRTSDASGNFSFGTLLAGTGYTLTPSKSGYRFSPTSVSGTIATTTTVNFSAALEVYVLSGRILLNSVGVSGVLIDGGALGNQTTDGTGRYTFSNVPHLTSYTLRPTRTGYVFSPISRSGTVNAASALGLDFTPSCATNFMIQNNTCVAIPPLIAGTLTASDGTSSQAVQISWANFSGVSNYQVYRSLTPGNLGSALSGMLSASPFFDTTAQPEVRYFYTVRAANIIGSIVWSNQDEGWRALDTSLLDDDQDLLNNADEQLFGTDPSNPDTDNDGVVDGIEVSNGTNPLDRGSVLEPLKTSLCSEWNGFLGPMYNISEYINSTNRTLGIRSTLYNSQGAAENNVTFSIRPGAQFDLLVHGLAGRRANAIGNICYSYSGQAGELDGRMIYYKPSAPGSTRRFEFAFALPFANGLKKSQFVSFNTFQPSFNSADSSNLVANWIQLTSEANSKQAGNLIIYALDGHVLANRRVELAARGRKDFPAHEFGRNLVGLVEWRPDSETKRFGMRNVRYLYNNPGTESSFDTAFQLEGTVGSGELLVAPVDAASSIIEVSNTRNVRNNISVKLYDPSGVLLHTWNFALAAFGTKHLIADSFLNGKKGTVSIKGSRRTGLLATVMSYGRDGQGSIRTMYGIAAREAIGQTLKTSYNTFLKQGCSLLLANATAVSQRATIRMKRSDGTDISGRNIPAVSQHPLPRVVTVPAKGLFDLNLCAYDLSDNYGVVTVEQESPSSLVGEVLRIGENEGYRFPTALRPAVNQ